MNPAEVGFGVVVRLTADGRARRLWKHHSDSTATIREVGLIDNGSGQLCVRVNVDADRKSRLRTMQLEYLEVVDFLLPSGRKDL